MTKTIGSSLQAHLEGDLTTLATCWKLTRPDSTIFAFTDHDEDIIYDGQTYEAASGFLPSALSQKSGLQVDNLDVFSFIESDKMKETDILSGLFDYSTIDVFLINYEDTSMGILTLIGGWILGEFQIRDNGFFAEVRSKAQKLTQNILDYYSPDCRATFTDSKCGIVASSYTHTGSVTAVGSSRDVFADSARTEITDVFTGGKLTWTSGNNSSYSMEIKAYDVTSKQFTLFQDMYYFISSSDAYSVLQGCDKLFTTCQSVYGNVNNFRGEPFIPGTDQILDYPS